MVKYSFLEWLTEQEQHERLDNYTVYDDYYYGQQDTVTILPQKIKDALSQELAIIGNYCQPVVNAKVQFICSNEINIQVNGNIDDPRVKQAEEMLYKIYKNNNMLHQNMVKLLRIAAKKGDAFIKLYVDPNARPLRDIGILGQIQMRVLRPDICFPKYRDDDYESMEYLIIKSYTIDAAGDPVWQAQVLYPDRIEFYTLDDEDAKSYEWKYTGTMETNYGFIPAIHVKNSVDDLEFGVSDLQCMVSLQDAVNKALTDLAFTMDYQAFQRLFVTGNMTQPNRRWDISPGTINELPDKDANVVVIQPASIQPFIEVLQKLEDMICFVTQTPKAALGRAEGGTVSGYALRVHYLPLENKCAEPKRIIRNQFNMLNSMIFKMLQGVGGQDFTDLDADIEFPMALPVDDKQLSESLVMQVNAKIKSKESAMQDLGVENVDDEKARITREEMETVYGSMETITAEAQATAEALEGKEVFAEPNIANVSEAVRQQAKESE